MVEIQVEIDSEPDVAGVGQLDQTAVRFGFLFLLFLRSHSAQLDCHQLPAG